MHFAESIQNKHTKYHYWYQDSQIGSNTQDPTETWVSLSLSMF